MTQSAHVDRIVDRYQWWKLIPSALYFNEVLLSCNYFIWSENIEVTLYVLYADGDTLKV